jgi:tetratricopeptide (TPR) repeat protein
MLGTVASVRGDYAQAVALTEEALALRHTLGHKTSIAYLLLNLSVSASRQADYGRTGAYLDEALEVARETGTQEAIAIVLANMGELALQQGQHVRAAERLRESLLLGVRLGDRWTVAEGIRTLAELAQAAHQPARSARLHGAAATVREDVGGTLEPAPRAEVDQSLAAIRDAIGAERLDTAWIGGIALSLDEAVAEALTLVDEVVSSSAE